MIGKITMYTCTNICTCKLQLQLPFLDAKGKSLTISNATIFRLDKYNPNRTCKEESLTKIG